MLRKSILMMPVAMLCLAAMTLANEPGPIEPWEFPVGAAPEAHPLWLVLAGQGAWGAILFGILGLIWKVARPYVVEWMARRKLEKLYLAVEACVAQTQAVYVDGMKAANADGKLSEDEKAEVFAACKENVVQFMKVQGVDVIREYGDIVVDCLIEYLLGKIKANNALARAVVAPLSVLPR